jgi:hypothetical protein
MWCWVIAAALFLCWFMRDDDDITRGGRPRGPQVLPVPSLPQPFRPVRPMNQVVYPQQTMGRLQPRDVVAVGPGPGYAPQTIAFRPPAIVLNTGSYQPPSVQVTQ